MPDQSAADWTILHSTLAVIKSTPHSEIEITWIIRLRLLSSWWPLFAVP